MNDTPSWLTKMETTVRVAMPAATDVVRKHTAEIPQQRRKEKLYLSLVGVAACLAAWLGYDQWGWSPWVWGPLGFFGANYIAGDYRRLLMRSLFAILADTTTFVTQAATKLKEIKAALLGLKNGNGAPPS